MKRLLTVGQKRKLLSAAVLARRDVAGEPSGEGTQVLSESTALIRANRDFAGDIREDEASVETMLGVQVERRADQRVDERPSPEPCVQHGSDESEVVDAPPAVEAVVEVENKMAARVNSQPDCQAPSILPAEPQPQPDALDPNQADAVKQPSSDQSAVSAAASPDQTILTVLAALLSELQAIRKLAEESVQVTRKRASTTKLPKTGLTEEEAEAFAGIRMLTMDHLEELFCAKRSTIYGWINDGKFFDSIHPSTKASRWPVSEVEAWVEKLKRERDESRLQSADDEH